MDTITILIADDHKLMREGLRNLIDGERPAMEVVAEAEDGRTALLFVRKLRPRVVLMDISMPGLNGVDAARQIVAEHPGIKVIALSMHSDMHFISEMFRAGASGYLLKDCAFEELISAIRSVVAGKSYMSPQLGGDIIKDRARTYGREKTSAFDVLNRREREVLQLLAEGKNTRNIAASLELSVKTVESYRYQIMSKLNLHSIAELVKYAIREGLTSPEP